MTDPVPGTAPAAPPNAVAASAAPGSALPDAGGGGGALAPGRRWRNYQVGEALPGLPGCFRATDIGSMEEVHLAARPIAGDGATRREVWARLDGLSLAHLVPLHAAFEEGGWRYEVTGVPPGESLRDYLRTHQVSLPVIERLVHQLSVALEVLHDNGLVHLRVRPENVYVQEDEQLVVSLGGLADATLHTRTDLIPLEIDPYYAPPEAAGLFRHAPGPGLCAWDWWSLGRLIQEAVHGAHVYRLLFERDVSGAPPELQPRAEAALRDRDPSGVRAGAVELLPEQTSPRVRALLRGLLASSRDGRWGGEQVQHWLQGAAAPDRYDLPRDARLFLWRRRAFTLAEAAEFFSQPDYAIEGQSQLFPLMDEPGTMRRFLEEQPQFRAERERVAAVLGLVESAPWQHLPVLTRRAAVAGLAWVALAPPSSRPPLCVQRWRVDAPGLAEMLADAPPPEAVNLARVLATPAYRRAVEPLDPAAARALAVLADHGFGAIERATQAGWLGAEDADGQARLLRYAFDADKDLVARRDRLRTAFATNPDERLAALLAAEKPDRVGLLLLAFTGERAKDFGYVSHAEWDQQRAQRLQRRAAGLARAVLWLRLRVIVAGSPAVLGPWSVFAALWSVPLALSVLDGAWELAAGIAALALGMRFAARARINALLARFAPDARRWSLSDRPARCRAEAEAALHALASAPAGAPAMLAEIGRIRRELRQLKLRPAPALPARPPRLAEFWLGAAAGAIVPVAVCVGLFLLAAHVPAGPPLAARPAAPAPSAAATDASAERELFEPFNDGFGRRLRGPLKAWDVPASLPPRPAIVRRMAPASPEQRAYALVGAELLLDVYPRSGLDVMLAVPVPAAEGWGIVLYDSLNRDLADRRTFFLADPLQEKAWYWVGNRRVVYLGVPPRLPAQFSLAPP